MEMISGRFEVRPAAGVTSGTPDAYEVWLKAGQSLDYEVTGPSLALSIEAFDPTGLVGTASITVTVTDVVNG